MTRFRSRLILGSAILLLVCSTRLLSAEETVVLLTLEGDRIGIIQSAERPPTTRFEALNLVHSYYNSLSADVLDKLDSLRKKTLELLPDFEVAYIAADSAEISEIIDEMNALLASMQEIHNQEFTREVVELLDSAYEFILPSLRD